MSQTDTKPNICDVITELSGNQLQFPYIKMNLVQIGQDMHTVPYYWKIMTMPDYQNSF